MDEITATTAPSNGPRRLVVVLGDITTLRTDAIVNAANQHLAGGGGVDGAIHRAAGARELHAACARLGGCPPGEAKPTPGFALAARWVIHTVGPVWRGGSRGEEAVLASCYRRSLEVAEGLGARTVAFPCISTGAYGFPPEQAARAAVQALRDSRSDVPLVLLVDVNRATLEHYAAAVGEPARRE